MTRYQIRALTDLFEDYQITRADSADYWTLYEIGANDEAQALGDYSSLEDALARTERGSRVEILTLETYEGA